MPNATKIEWADLTINPTRGCSHCSPGCDNCYAERFAARHVHNPQTAHAYAGLVDEHGKWTGNVSERDDSVFDRLPRTPKRIFIGSMTDLFFSGVNDTPRQAVTLVDGDELEFAPDTMHVRIAMLLLQIGKHRQHTFMMLTKRPENMETVMKLMLRRPLPNLWLGVTICNRGELWKLDFLRETPAALRFVSFEPLLSDLGTVDLSGIGWVIAGGETGPGARPMHPDWVRSLCDQCQGAEVPFFFKSWGEWGTTAIRLDTGLPSFGMFESFTHYCNKAPTWMHKGDKLICPDGHVPTHGAKEGKSYPMCIVRRVGKKQAGRLLDEREWNEIPEARHE